MTEFWTNREKSTAVTFFSLEEGSNFVQKTRQNGIKVTFLSFPYTINHPTKVDRYIKIPTLLTLSSMKAFALGRRAKWKDYVDLYFILRDYYTIKDIKEEAEKNFGELFSEKLFREKLAFHKDIDYSEPVEFLLPDTTNTEIKQFLIDKAIDIDQ